MERGGYAAQEVEGDVWGEGCGTELGEGCGEGGDGECWGDQIFTITTSLLGWMWIGGLMEGSEEGGEVVKEI